jgi:hypothetical protein
MITTATEHAMNLELFANDSGTRSAYLSVGSVEVWAQVLGGGEAPDWPHPKDKRWGVNREPGGTSYYLGPLVVTLSRRASRGAKAATT